MLPDKDPAESIMLEFSFDGELDAIDSAVVSVSVNAGKDDNVAQMLRGAIQRTGTSVFQRLGGGVAAVDYIVRCEATRGDDVRVRKEILKCR